ncbi:hypothetical protein B0H13DRAFT_2674365 [Mycena leptocephala]|nr:hypothetical protein B0H13DRAFT_2674365 [Mycena leptocephala]
MHRTRTTDPTKSNLKREEEWAAWNGVPALAQWSASKERVCSPWPYATPKAIPSPHRPSAYAYNGSGANHRIREGSKYAHPDPEPHSPSPPPPTCERAHPHPNSYNVQPGMCVCVSLHPKNAPNPDIDVPCTASTSIAHTSTLDDGENGAESEGEGDGEDIRHHAHAQDRAILELRVHPRFFISISTELRECAGSIFISFSTSIPVDLPISIPIPIPNSSSFELRARWTNSSTSSSVRTITKTRAEDRRAILIDLAIDIPPLQIPLRASFYRSPSNPNPELDATQNTSSRYNIFEDIGCLGETYKTPVTVVPFHLHPHRRRLRFRIKSFYHSRAQFRELLSASAHANLNLNRYIRLMAFASTDPPHRPPAIFVLYSNVAVAGLSPVVQGPRIYWHADPYSAASVETLRWATVACACPLSFLGYFWFADDAIKNYRGAFNSAAKRMGYTSTGSSGGLSSTGCVLLLSFVSYPSCLFISQRNLKFPLSCSSSRGASATLPVFIRKDTTLQRDPFESFSDMSASDGGILPLEYDAEKAGSLMLGDVSGMLPDYKESDYSSIFLLVGYGERGWGGGRRDRSLVFAPRERAYPQPAGTSARLCLCGTRVISFDPRARRLHILLP